MGVTGCPRQRWDVDGVLGLRSLRGGHSLRPSRTGDRTKGMSRPAAMKLGTAWLGMAHDAVRASSESRVRAGGQAGFAVGTGGDPALAIAVGHGRGAKGRSCRRCLGHFTPTFCQSNHGDRILSSRITISEANRVDSKICLTRRGYK